MHKARSFFYVCGGLLCLALAYHLGAQNATAQAPADPVVGIASSNVSVLTVVTASGQTFSTTDPGQRWYRGANVFGAATSATQETWGSVKARYRTEGPAKQAQDR